jgi:hypothetical protein
MLFDRTRSRDIEQFATDLARDFAKAYSLADAKSERNSVKKLARAIDAACERATTFQKEKKLGVYGKAKLGTTFKWELKTLGYDDAFVDEFTRSILLRLSR